MRLYPQNLDLLIIYQDELGDDHISAYFEANPDIIKTLTPILDEEGLLRIGLLKLLSRTRFSVAAILNERLREMLNDQKTVQADKISIIIALFNRSNYIDEDAAAAFLILHDLYKAGRWETEDKEIVADLIFKLEHINTATVVTGLHIVLADLTTETKSKFYSWLIEHGTMWKETLTKVMFKVPIDDHPTTLINS